MQYSSLENKGEILLEFKTPVFETGFFRLPPYISVNLVLCVCVCD